VVQAWPLVPELVLFVEEGPLQVRVLLLAQVSPQVRVRAQVRAQVPLQVPLQVLLAQAETLLQAEEFLWMHLLQDLQRFLQEPHRVLLEWLRVG